MIFSAVLFGSRLEQLARQPATECPRALEHAPGAALLIAAISCLGAFSNADRLDTELLKRAFLGWLRGERDHCKMVAIPTSKDEDAKRPNRDLAFARWLDPGAASQHPRRE